MYIVGGNETNTNTMKINVEISQNVKTEITLDSANLLLFYLPESGNFLKEVKLS